MLTDTEELGRIKKLSGESGKMTTVKLTGEYNHSWSMHESNVSGDINATRGGNNRVLKKNPSRHMTS